jgi:DNA-binding MarR family transcriptional regulator
MKSRPPSLFERARAAEVRDTCACFNLRRASRSVTQLYDAALRPAGIRATQFTLLALLSGTGKVRITRLAQAAGMDYTTLVRNLNVLEREGLARSHETEDGRVREVSLSPKGEGVLERAMPLWEKAQGRLKSKLGSESLGRMLADLAVTAAALQES